MRILYDLYDKLYGGKEPEVELLEVDCCVCGARLLREAPGPDMEAVEYWCEVHWVAIERQMIQKSRRSGYSAAITKVSE